MTEAEHRMQALVETLCSPSFLPRNPGTDGGAAERDLLRSRLEELGLSPVGEKGFDQTIPAIGGTNLLGRVDGRSDRYVILAAHYDACLWPNPGADDNAAAVAVTLEAARRLKDADPFRSVIIALFDAEEPPYFLGPEMGSQWFVDHPTIPLDRVDMMVCLDLVGHALGPEGTPQAVRDSVFVLGAEKSTGTPELFDELPAVAGIEPRRVDNYIIEPMSDYYAFMQADIPFLFYSCGRSEHYHAETDTPEKLDYAKMAAFTDHLTNVMLALANRTDTPVYLADGIDDKATLRSLRSVVGELGDVSPEAAMAAALLGQMQALLAEQGSLGDQERMAIRSLVSQVERALRVTFEEDRVSGALIGLAAGDALGAGYEFGPPVDGPVEMIGGGAFGWEPGEWTDDTQMAICIVESAKPGAIDLVSVGDRFIEWATECTDIGVQTRTVLSAAGSGQDLPDIAQAHHRRNPSRSAGNGSLMRTGVVALPFLGDRAMVTKTARNVSALTHFDPQCQEACLLWSLAIEQAIEDGELPDLKQGLTFLPGDRSAHWESIIDDAEARPPTAFTPNGYVVTAFQAAWSSIVHTPPGGGHLEAALVAAVRIGDDTDTVAAIAGTLLGAAYGASAIPEPWLEELHGWPGYTEDDLRRIVLSAAGDEE